MLGSNDHVEHQVSREVGLASGTGELCKEAKDEVFFHLIRRFAYLYRYLTQLVSNLGDFCQ